MCDEVVMTYERSTCFNGRRKTTRQTVRYLNWRRSVILLATQ